MANPRPLARLIVCCAVLVLGGVAATGLPLAYMPSWSFPELQVSLRLQEATELGDLTRRWVEPLEAAVRSSGDVRSMAGEVDGQGGSLRVRYTAGIDIEKKAARLESELGSLRRRLPEDASLQVRPRSQGDDESSMILWLSQGDDPGRFDPALLESLRRLREVREVTVAGRPPQEIRVRASTRHVDAQQLSQVLEGRGDRQRLGDLRRDGRRTVLWTTGQNDRPLSEQRLRLGSAILPLTSVAQMTVRQQDPSWVAHRDGRRGWVLFIQRELGVSPLALEGAVLDALENLGVEPEVFLNEAEPLRQLLERLLLGLALSILVLTLGGAWLAGGWGAVGYGLALPVALAAACNAYWLFDIPLDVTTLPALVIALIGSLLFLILRHSLQPWLAVAMQMVTAGVLPVTIALASGSLAPLLKAPGKAYWVATVAALTVLWILPVPMLSALPGPAWRRFLKRFLRHGWTVLLLALTWSYLWFVAAGNVLSPRPGTLPAALMDLAVYLQLPEGSTLQQAELQMQTIEAHLSRQEEIESHWSVFNRQGGTLGISLRPEDRDIQRLHVLQRRLHSELGHLGAAVSLQPFAGSGRQSGEPLRFTDSIEDEATFDIEDAYTYRCILRSTDLVALRQSHDHLLEILRGRKWNIWPNLIRSEWRQPTVRAELVPRRDAPQEALRQATASIQRLASPQRSRSMDTAGTLSLRMLDRDAPEEEDDIPQRWQLMALQNPEAPLSAGHYFQLREELASPGISRQGGRFVLPVSVRMRGAIEAMRRDNASTVHYQLRQFRTATGVDLELPDTGVRTLRQERLRLWGMAATFPLLMWILSICRLNSFVLATMTLVPMTIALTSATPWLIAGKSHIDEMGLLGLAAALAACFPSTVEVAARLPSHGPLPAGATYRWLAHRLPLTALLSIAAAVLLAVPSWGLDVDRHPWALPLRGAAVILAVGPLASYLVLPLLLRGFHHWKSRDPVVEAEQTCPPVWHQPGELSFSVRHLTKIYGGQFKAIDQLEFDLQPGIVGLLGPNGAGKTTLLRLLCGLLEPTRGQILFRGVPITSANLPEYRRLVGFLPQEFNAYDGVTAQQFLDYWALERGMRDPRQRRQEVDKVLSNVGLSDVAGRHVRQFSGGMRRRIGIARALLGDPPIVIVDEPTTGLDVESRNRLRETLLSVAGERIIIFSTHIASDVAAAASRILLLHEGQLLFDGAAEELIHSANGRVFEALLSDAELRDFSHHYRVTTRVRTRQGIRVRAVTFGEQTVAGDLVKPNLEEAYLAWLGERVERRGRGAESRPSSLLDLEAWRGP